MILLLTTLALAAPASTAGTTERLGPSPNLLLQLQKQNRHHPWLAITSDSGRVVLKVRGITSGGLAGFTAREWAPVPARPFAWREIGRIDEVVTLTPRWRLVGGIALGIAGAGLGNMIGAADDRGGQFALLGLAVGGGLGGWMGSVYGDRFKRERPWYVADTSATWMASRVATEAEARASVVESAADPSRPATEPAEPATQAERAVLRVASRIDPNDAIRVEGGFGRFQGFASVAGPQGLEGLRADPRADRAWVMRELPTRISWGEINRIHLRGGSGVVGAVTGAALFGGAGALLGAALVGALGRGEVSIGEGALGGAALAGSVGAVLGSGAGALVRRWRVAYRRA